MRLRSKCLVSTLLALFSMGAMADDNVHYIMYINMTDGTKEQYIVSDHPTVSFDKEYVMVSTEKLSAKFPTASVVDYTFKQTSATDIDDVKISESAVQLSVKYVDNRNVVVRGMQTKGKISVYTVDGQMQSAAITYVDGGADVSLADLPDGTYIIRIGKEKSIKVFKK